MINSDIIKIRLRDLQRNETEINSFLTQVNKKIVEMEESYLAETNFGNIIRGFDIGRLAFQQNFNFVMRCDLLTVIVHFMSFLINFNYRW